MQNFIKKASLNSLTIIIEEIKESLPILITDQYGNYFIQKMLHNVSSEQRLKILTALHDSFVHVSCDEVGTHPMQRLVEMVNLEEEREVIFSAIQN